MTIYVDCAKCNNEFEFNVVDDRCCNAMEVDLVKQYCDCPMTGDEMYELEQKAVEKYDPADEGFELEVV